MRFAEFSSILPHAKLRWRWRLTVCDVTLDLSDRMPHPIGFADDIFFARSAIEAGRLLGSLVTELEGVGLVLDVDKHSIWKLN